MSVVQRAESKASPHARGACPRDHPAPGSISGPWPLRARPHRACAHCCTRDRGAPSADRGARDRQDIAAHRGSRRHWGCVCRHYNASLLNFDDLVGFPLPDAERWAEYVGPPRRSGEQARSSSTRSAAAAPTSRTSCSRSSTSGGRRACLLEGLRYRWSAMNPPVRDEDEGNCYQGSEPLDPALADRFAYIVEMPGWERLERSRPDRHRLSPR